MVLTFWIARDRGWVCRQRPGVKHTLFDNEDGSPGLVVVGQGEDVRTCVGGW